MTLNIASHNVVHNSPVNDYSFTVTVIAKRCMSNLETTFEYGGRRNVPSEDELHAIRVLLNNWRLLNSDHN